MKRTTGAAMLLALVASLGFSPIAHSEDAKVDKDFAACLKTQASITVEDGKWPDQAKLDAVKKFQCSSFKGLSKLRNLEEFIFKKKYQYDNDAVPVDDLAQLSKLTKLKKLTLVKAGIRDISFLKDLVNLEELDLHADFLSFRPDLVAENKITDASALSGLKKLKKLNLNNNLVADLSPLAGLTDLEELKLGHDSPNSTTYEVKEQPEEHGLKLITDLSPLAGLTKLTWLDLERNTVQDVSALKGLSKLKFLDLDDNYVHDLRPVCPINIKSIRARVQPGYALYTPIYAEVNKPAPLVYDCTGVLPMAKTEYEAGTSGLKKYSDTDPLVFTKAGNHSMVFQSDKMPYFDVKNYPNDRRPRQVTYIVIPAKPADKVEATNWIDSRDGGAKDCQAGKVKQTRTVTTTSHKWDRVAKKWLLDKATAATKTESQMRPMTDAELKTCAGDAPKAKVEATDWADAANGKDCAKKTVKQTRKITTTPYTWDIAKRAWVLDTVTAKVITEEQARAMTDAELKVCAGGPPESKVEATDWTDAPQTDAKDCTKQTVKQTRKVTTTPYTWNSAAHKWELDSDNATAKAETQMREMTGAEKATCEAGHVVPPSTDKVEWALSPTTPGKSVRLEKKKGTVPPHTKLLVEGPGVAKLNKDGSLTVTPDANATPGEKITVTLFDAKGRLLGKVSIPVAKAMIVPAPQDRPENLPPKRPVTSNRLSATGTGVAGFICLSLALATAGTLLLRRRRA